MTAYDDNKKLINDLAGARHAGMAINGQDRVGRQQARAFLGEYARANLPEGVQIDFGSLPDVDNYLAGAELQFQRIALGHYGENVDSILGSVPQGDLVKLIGAVEPTETGSSEHDELVRLSREIRDLAGTIRGVAEGNGDYGTVFNETIRPYIERELTRKLSTETRPENRYLDYKTKSSLKSLVLGSMAHQQRGLAVLGDIVKELSGKLMKKLGGDSGIAKYVATNIRAYGDQGDGQALMMADLLAGQPLARINAVMNQAQTGNSIAGRIGPGMEDDDMLMAA